MPRQAHSTNPVVFTIDWYVYYLMQLARQIALLLALACAGCDPGWNYVPEGRSNVSQIEAWRKPHSVTFRDAIMTITKIHLFSNRLSADFVFHQQHEAQVVL